MIWAAILLLLLCLVFIPWVDRYERRRRDRRRQRWREAMREAVSLRESEAFRSMVDRTTYAPHEHVQGNTQDRINPYAPPSQPPGGGADGNAAFEAKWRKLRRRGPIAEFFTTVLLAFLLVAVSIVIASILSD